MVSWVFATLQETTLKKDVARTAQFTLYACILTIYPWTLTHHSLDWFQYFMTLMPRSCWLLRWHTTIALQRRRQLWRTVSWLPCQLVQGWSAGRHATHTVNDLINDIYVDIQKSKQQQQQQANHRNLHRPPLRLVFHGVCIYIYFYMYIIFIYILYT